MTLNYPNLFSINVTILFSIWCGATYADSICDVALKSGAFNMSNYEQTSSLLLKKRDDACNADYNSQADATAAAQNSGGSIGYGGFSFSASDAKQTATGRYSIKDSKFCTASAEELETFTSVRAKQQVADVALAAWSGCIEKVETNKLFVSYKPNIDGTGMTGKIIRHLRDGGIGKISGIIATDTGVQSDKPVCRIGTQLVDVHKTYDIQIDKSSIAISCHKNANKTVSIALITSEGDQDWIELPSVKEQRQIDITIINDAITKLRKEIDKASVGTEKIKDDLVSVTSDVGMKYNELKGQIAAKVDVTTADQRIASQLRNVVRYQDSLVINSQSEAHAGKAVRCLMAISPGPGMVLAPPTTPCENDAPLGVAYQWRLFRAK